MIPPGGWKPGYLAQICDDQHSWFPAILVVSEVKAASVQAYVIVPLSNDGSKRVGEMYIRIHYDKIEMVGESLYVHEHHREDQADS